MKALLRRYQSSAPAACDALPGSSAWLLSRFCARPPRSEFTDSTPARSFTPTNGSSTTPLAPPPAAVALSLPRGEEDAGVAGVAGSRGCRCCGVWAATLLAVAHSAGVAGVAAAVCGGGCSGCCGIRQQASAYAGLKLLLQLCVAVAAAAVANISYKYNSLHAGAEVRANSLY